MSEPKGASTQMVYVIMLRVFVFKKGGNPMTSFKHSALSQPTVSIIFQKQSSALWFDIIRGVKFVCAINPFT